jgi:hypothetical protein
MPSVSVERRQKSQGTFCDSTEEEFAIEDRYPYEWGDICGTSYGPYPFDESKFVRPDRHGASLSSFGSHDRCSEGHGRSVKSPIRGSPDGIFACFSKWLRWAVA